VKETLYLRSVGRSQGVGIDGIPPGKKSRVFPNGIFLKILKIITDLPQTFFIFMVRNVNFFFLFTCGFW
jgi:hypothetical protein